MKYLQVMPTDQAILGVDLGFVLVLSIILIAVIFLFDRYKAIINWIMKQKV